MEVQGCNDLVNHILVAVTNITGQPRQLVHVKDCIWCHCEGCIQVGGGDFEQFSWGNTQNCAWLPITQPDICVKYNTKLKLKRTNNFGVFAFIYYN